MIPDDDFILLSLINMKLRDNYASFAELCEDEDWDGEQITARLAAIGYSYDSSQNAFK